MPSERTGSEINLGTRSLNGWKEIASYLGKSSRTAMRWEEEFDLPVHRIGGGSREIIFAFREEIDRWQNSTERLRFESLLADTSARFINLDATALDSELQNALAAICESLGLNHGAFWQVSQDGSDSLVLTHVVRDPELPPLQTPANGIDLVPWSTRKLLANEIVYVPDTANPPEEVDPKSRKLWSDLGIKSVIAFPLSIGGRAPIGAIGFGSSQKRLDWTDRLQRRLRLTADIFANVLDRREIERKLQENEVRLKLAAEAAGVGFFTLDPGTGKMWASDILLKLAGLQPGGELDLAKVISLVHPEDREIVQNAVAEAMDTGKETQITFRFLYPDGSQHRMMSRGCRYNYTPERPPLLMGVTFEIK